MINLVSTGSVAGICCFAMSVAETWPAAAQCPRTEGGAGPAACTTPSDGAARSARLRGLSLPLLPPDEELSAAMLEPPLTLDFDGAPLPRSLDATSAQSLIPSPRTAAPPTQSASSVGAWSKLEKERTRDDTRTRTGVGIDVKPSRSATLGMAVETDEEVAATTLRQQSRVGATFGLKTSPLLSFEAKAALARQGAGDVANPGTPSGQNELSAKVKGDWRMGALKLAPSLSIARAAEAGAAEAGKAPKGTVVVAPSISRPVELGPSRTLEPFVSLKQEIDISQPPGHPAAAGRADATRSAGAGVKLESRDQYSLSVTTDVENLETERHNVKSQLRLNWTLK